MAPTQSEYSVGPRGPMILAKEYSIFGCSVVFCSTIHQTFIMAATIFVAALFLSMFIPLTLLVKYFLLPLQQIRNIPTIPFWVALLPLIKDVDQQEIFKKHINKPLQKHGAVKIFFAAQWNVLIHRPEYMAEVFRQEEVYQKSGNQKKIPHSVLASLLGDNIISSHGEVWKLYRQIVRPGLQIYPDLEVLLNNAERLRKILVSTQALAMRRGVGIQESIQRYTIANFAQNNFNINFGVSLSEQYCKIDRVHESYWLTQVFDIVDPALKRCIFTPDSIQDQKRNIQAHLYELSISRSPGISQPAASQAAGIPLH